MSAMQKVIGTLLCILALSVAALPAAYGMEHDHGSAKMAMTMDEDRSGDPAKHDHTTSNHCDIVPGHCNFIAAPGETNTRATHYMTSMRACLSDDRVKPKHRPETELRPPRV